MKILTDEQFANELSAEAPAGDAEVLTLQTALDSYRTEMLQWAERRSAAQPSLAARARRGERWAALPRWSLATIAIVTIAAGVAHLSEQHETDSEQPVAARVISSPQARSSAEDIAADNKLLHSIDAELSYRAQSPVDGLDLKAHEARGSESADSEE